jgi:hypothetical protein
LFARDDNILLPIQEDAHGAHLVLGLKWTHLNRVAVTIKIEQLFWHQDVASERQNELTRRIQEGLARALVKKARDASEPPPCMPQNPPAPGEPPSFADVELTILTVQ